MNKSVLVIGTPERCIDCEIGQNMSNAMEVCIRCPIVGKSALDGEAETIPGWCPLKPLPEKKEYINSNSNIETTKNIAAAGWNACIDEITGGNADD